MPSHYTKKEFAIREERRKRREASGTQLDLFSKKETILHETKEWTTEHDGHRWLWRSYGTHAECVPLS